ncbi:hypothetical protein F383_38835 [Gossypium arboreum]|uniref:Uncharacterized protein n=1 Tax=Gossypium arboreum TaxID=29729 RepID=A0A0B0MIE9_GOSAR|nr:hypothetical protein F383_38835 [Gossypium arboreum]
MTLVSFTRQGNHVRPCQNMTFINYDKAKIPCKTMPRHGNSEFIRQCQEMEMYSKWFNGKFKECTKGKVR